MNGPLDSHCLFDVEFTHDDYLIGSFTSSLRTAERRSCESCQFDHVSESRMYLYHCLCDRSLLVSSLRTTQSIEFRTTRLQRPVMPARQ
jgi:hypothetical protein